jgi:hypothetical protein
MSANIPQQPTVDEIRALEVTLLDPAVRASSETFNDLLADDFTEFGASGRTFNKQQVIADLLQQPEERFAIEDFRIEPLGPEAVLVIYRAVRTCNPSNKAQRSLRSSIWKYEDGRWQMLFHQGTPI